MIFRSILHESTGCASYLFGCGTRGKCTVVDPHREHLDEYVRAAESGGMAITHVFETHVHADHVSGGRELAARTGARHALHRSADVDFPFFPVDDGQVVEFGNTLVRVMHTPGHTPESISLVVTDLRRGTEPWFVCTGDTLFVGAVGRPDLPGHERENAATLFHSLRALLALPGELEVFPAHIGGSACGAGISGKPTSTLAFEKRWNPLLTTTEEDFITRVIGDIPEKPAHMHTLMASNRGRAP